MALACGGEPERAEVAIEFFNVLRQLDVDALLVAHITKDESDKAPKAPFGSIMWSNAARSTWFVKRTEDTDTPSVTLYHRKVNDGRRHKPVTISFDDSGQRVRLTVLGRREDMLMGRIREYLRSGAKPLHDIASAAEASNDETRRLLEANPGFAQTVRDGMYVWGIAQLRAVLP